MELQQIIEKWEKHLALHKSIVDNTLSYTKEERLKSAYQAQAIASFLNDLKNLNTK